MQATLARAPSVAGEHPQAAITRQGWVGDAPNMMMALLFATRQTQCDCIVPGQLVVWDKRLVASDFHEHELASLCAYKDKVIVFVSLLTESRTPGEPTTGHAALLVLDRQRRQFSIFNPHGHERHIETYASHDALLEQWVRETFTDEFDEAGETESGARQAPAWVRDRTTDACPAVQGAEPWCQLWVSWWMHQVIVRPRNDGGGGDHGAGAVQAVPGIRASRQDRLAWFAQLRAYYDAFRAFRHDLLQEARARVAARADGVAPPDDLAWRSLENDTDSPAHLQARARAFAAIDEWVRRQIREAGARAGTQSCFASPLPPSSSSSQPLPLPKQPQQSSVMIEAVRNIQWAADEVNWEITVLHAAAKATLLPQCDVCVVLGSLAVFPDGIGGDRTFNQNQCWTPTEMVEGTSPARNKVLVRLRLYDSHHSLAQSGVVVVDRTARRYVVYDAYRKTTGGRVPPVHGEPAADADVLYEHVDAWVRHTFGDDMERDEHASACPRLSRRPTAYLPGWCALYAAWWMHHTLVDRTVSATSSASSRTRSWVTLEDLARYYGELHAFRRALLRYAPLQTPLTDTQRRILENDGVLDRQTWAERSTIYERSGLQKWVRQTTVDVTRRGCVLSSGGGGGGGGGGRSRDEPSLGAVLLQTLPVTPYVDAVVQQWVFLGVEWLQRLRHLRQANAMETPASGAAVGAPSFSVARETLPPDEVRRAAALRAERRWRALADRLAYITSGP